jgi:serine/threonine protein phosphatase PrpC
MLNPRIICGSAQSVGKIRKQNEDALFVMQVTLAEGESQVPFGIFIVADGMGGHEHGEVASQISTRVMSSHLINELFAPLIGANNDDNDKTIRQVLSDGLAEVQTAVQQYAPGGGTTLTTLVIMGNMMATMHIGDSRGYFIDINGDVEQITHDHSVVQQLIDDGTITEQQAINYPQKNVLYQAVGQMGALEPDIRILDMPSQGTILLCSDGLWGEVGEKEMVKAINSEGNPLKVAEKLMDLANGAGGKDNISAIVIKIL